MHHPGFFENAGPFTLREVADAAAASLPENADGAQRVHSVEPLDSATSTSVSFLENRKYIAQAQGTAAAACFIRKAFVDKLPDSVVPLVSDDPYRSFAKALFLFYPDAGTPLGDTERMESIAGDATIEDDVVIEPGAVIGSQAMIGRGSRIAANAVVGRRCAIGRDCYIGPGASVQHGLLGNRVFVHAGVRIGTDGFGFAMGPGGHFKVPQIGRVIVQDDVEIGANTTIDRGALKDTIIGEGTKIDNMVQIGHNVVIGRHCVLVSQVGIAGSSELGDFVVCGGQTGIAGHVTIASGAMFAAKSGVKSDITKAGRYGGAPAKPFREWARELAALGRLARTDDASDGRSDDDTP